MAQSGALWVGDTLQLTASAIRQLNEFCSAPDELSNSQLDPAGFVFSSSDTTILSVTPLGRAIAKLPGVVNAGVTYRGLTGSNRIAVTPVVATVSIIATPANPHVSDTISLTQHAYDATGGEIAGASAWSSASQPPWASLISTTASTLRYVAVAPGVISASAKAIRLNGSVPTASIAVQISP